MTTLTNLKNPDQITDQEKEEIINEIKIHGNS